MPYIMEEKVSIIIAVYNVANYIVQCAETLFGQTYRDIEYIFIDDAATDGSIERMLEVLEKYPNRVDQVRVIRHSTNQGVALTKTEGIKESKGSYVWIVDPDDFVELNAAEMMMDKAVSENADMVICDFYNYYEDGRIDRRSLAPNGIEGNGENVRDDIINRIVNPFHVVKLVRRRIFDERDVVWPAGRFQEDVVFSLISAYYSRRISHVDVPLYYYRYHPNSLTHKMSENACLMKFQESIINIDIMIDFLVNQGMSEKYWRGILIHKLRTKNRLLGIQRKWKYRVLWFKTYPEINKTLFCGDSRYKSSYKEKVWLFAILFGLYPIPRIKKLLNYKFLPFLQWRTFY